MSESADTAFVVRLPGRHMDAGFGAHFVKTDPRDGLGSEVAQRRLRERLEWARLWLKRTAEAP